MDSHGDILSERVSNGTNQQGKDKGRITRVFWLMLLPSANPGPEAALGLASPLPPHTHTQASRVTEASQGL